MSRNAVVYVDLGGSRISAIAAVVQEDHALKILGEQVRPSDDVKSGVVEKMTGAAFKINEAIKLLQNSLRLKVPITYVSISVNAKTMKHHTYSVESRIHSVVTEKLLTEMEKECRADIKSEKIAILEVIPLAYYIDGKRIENPIGKQGFRLRIDYNLIIGHYQVKDALERTIERTGIAVDYIHLGMEAIATAILDERDKEEGCAIISFGATTTTLGVYCEGKLQELLVVPLGGQNITKDIQELGISFDNAEKLKCRTGSAMEKLVAKPMNVQIPSVYEGEQPVKISTLFLATIIEARLEEMLEPLFKQIDAIPYPLHGGIVITGGASKLKGIEEFISEKTGFQVRVGNHADWLSEDTDPQFYAPEYSQAVGAMLLSNDLIESQVELQQTAIKSKLPRKGLIGKLSEKFADGMGDLFRYDEIERQQYNVPTEEHLNKE